MANEAHKEPTMEEILASIRKIINDDGSPSASAAPAADPAPTVMEVASESTDGLEEMTFEPESAELDSVMFEESPEDFGGFESQEEVDPFDDSDFELSDTSLDTEELIEPVELDDVELPEVELEEDVEAAVEEGPSFEEMLGTLNKVSEEFESVGGDASVEEEAVEAAAPAAAAPPLRTETAPAPPVTEAAAPVAPAAPAAAAAAMTTDGALEGLVRQLLDPVIREWVDNNLKALVDETVQSLVEDKVQTLVEQKVDEEVQRNVRLALQKFASGS